MCIRDSSQPVIGEDRPVASTVNSRLTHAPTIVRSPATRSVSPATSGSRPGVPNRSGRTAVHPSATTRSANPSTWGEMPGISPQVLGFADRVVALGCTAVLPDLFGTPGRDPLVAGLTERVAGLRTIVGACVSREFTVLATGRSSPITGWLRAVSYTHLRAHETPEHLVCRLLLEKKKK